MTEAIWITLCVYIVLSVIAVALYLPKMLGYRYAFKKLPRKKAVEKRKISIIIPARGESRIIGDLFASLEKQTYSREDFDINVIVKDADDPTIAIAESFGAHTYVVSAQKCKGDALDGYFKAIGKEGICKYDAFVIVDADAVLAPDYAAELNNALEYNYDIFITRKFAKNYLGDRKNRSVFSNCSALTWPIIDDLGNLYRMHKEIPLNLCGQGMMIRRNVIEEIGGWPYRTLTEDYELKLDSILKGYKSMFYPYAVIYTEEALTHEENFQRRLRWLMGYSQCDRKYKEQIRDQAKQRGKLTNGEREYFFGIVPLLLYLITTALTIFAGAALAIFYAVQRQPYFFYASWLLVFTPFCVMYVLLFCYGVLAYFSDTEAFRALSKKEKWAMFLFNPFYLLEYVPIFLCCRRNVRKGRAPAWKQTERMTYREGTADRAADRAAERGSEEVKEVNQS